MMASQGPFNAFGVFFNPIREDFNWTHTISAAFSISIIVRGFFSPLMGGLTDRLGPRRVMAVCGLVIGLGFFLMSRVEALWQFYLFYGLVLGCGMSGIWVPVLSSVARWFVERRSLMTSIVVVGVGIAGIIIPPLLNSSIEARGWSGTYLILAVVVAVVLVGLSRFFRPPQAKAVPQEDLSAATATAVNRMTLGEALRIRQLWLLVMVFSSRAFCLSRYIWCLTPRDWACPR
jgi:MFS family permease